MGRYSVGYSKVKFGSCATKLQKLTEKYLIEKAMLLNFLDLFAIFYSRYFKETYFHL